MNDFELKADIVAGELAAFVPECNQLTGLFDQLALRETGPQVVTPAAFDGLTNFIEPRICSLRAIGKILGSRKLTGRTNLHTVPWGHGVTQVSGFLGPKEPGGRLFPVNRRLQKRGIV